MVVAQNINIIKMKQKLNMEVIVIKFVIVLKVLFKEPAMVMYPQLVIIILVKQQ